MNKTPLAVHIGTQPATWWDDIESRQRQYGDDASPWLQDKWRPTIADPNLDWDALGCAPRWVGQEAADCVAALCPSIFANQGADEYQRFRQGAERRGELAVVISSIGSRDPDRPRNVFGTQDDSIGLGDARASIVSRPIGTGAKVHISAELSDEDNDLARRLINCTPTPTWRALDLSAHSFETYNDAGTYPTFGSLKAILESHLGEPVVGVWTSPDGGERRYVLPVEAPWPLVLNWLTDQGLPALVPDALRRAHHLLPTDVHLLTARERNAHAALDALTSRYNNEREELERELEDAEDAATEIRHPLLYGSGTDLEGAIREVLESAGVSVVDLDSHLGGTTNADLLCTHGHRSRLVEVKSASGSASERCYQDLIRHLREWKALPDASPVDGGVLIINHEHRVPPHQRSAVPFGRPEFIAAQSEPIVTTLQLLEAWRDGDQATIRNLIFGTPDDTSSDKQVIAEPEEAGQRKRRLFRRE